MFALRDKSGSTPLHFAVKAGLHEIARHVGDASPAEVLHLEDGVGNTPLETATQLWLQHQTRTTYSEFPYMAPTVDPLTRVIRDYEWDRKRVRKPSAADVAQLKDTIERLVANGRLRRGTKLATALDTFAETMDAKAKLRTREEEEAKKTESQNDPESEEELTPANWMSDVFKTFEYIAGAVAARPARRGLVHLDDVLRSVKASLDRSEVQGKKYRNHDNDGLELEAEVVEDDDTKSKKRSLVAHFHLEPTMSLFEADCL